MLNGSETFLTQLNGIEGAERVRAALDAVEHPELYIVTTGEFNNGKSMLVNALLGRWLLSSSPVPTTGQITAVRFGQPEHVQVRRRDGTEKEYPLAALEQLTTLDENGTAADEVDQITVLCNAPLLEPNLVLVDTPGTNDDTAQTSRAEHALATADVVLWVLRADAVLKQGERAFAAQWLADNPEAVLTPVVNFMNLLPQREQGKVRQRLTALLERQHGTRVAWVKELTGRPFFEIDARQGLAHTADGANALGEDLPRLSAWLRELAGPAGAQLKARCRAARIRVRIEAIREKTRSRLRELAEQAASARRTREARMREMRTERRHFQSWAQAALQQVETEAAGILSKARDGLLSCSLANQTVNSLGTRISSEGRLRLADAAKKIAAAAESALKTLAMEFLVPPGGLEVSWQAFPLDFSVTLPPTGFFDDLLSLVGATPTCDYLAKVRPNMRLAWDMQAARFGPVLKTVWRGRLRKLRKQLNARSKAETPGDIQGWAGSLTDELVSIKAHECWLRRGAPASRNGQATRDWRKAEGQLKKRLTAGELIRPELLRVEAAQAALECLEARYANVG